ncbi:MAG: HD-GYP domain-containing protein [Gammaproteobacteria bacterium]|nr:HD-GYP domain-containing protein [Gammaproteobacteria bacterium]
MHKLRIPVAELELGMHVVELDRPWEETPFLLQGFTLHADADVQAVRQYCRHVWIELSQAYPRVVDPDGGGARKSRAAPQPPSKSWSLLRLFRKAEAGQSGEAPPKPVSRQLKDAAPGHVQASRLVRSLMDEVRLGNAINTTSVRLQVRECVANVLENPDAMMWLAQLKAKDERSASHSLNVCILAAAFGRHLGLGVAELETLGLAALLHDIGKTLLPTPLLHRQAELNAEDEAFLRRHCEFGRQILMNTRGLPDKVIDVAYGHHERLDGGGYPRGLTGEFLTQTVRIVSLVDAFEAMTSNHYYSDAQASDEALDRLRAATGQFDARLVREFAELIGDYPVGSLVELAGGEVALVIVSSRQRPERPRVLVLRDAAGQPCPQRILDLAARPELGIARMLPPGAHGIDVQALVREGLRLKVD